MKRLYVSGVAGNDAWSGTLEAPNAAGVDGPLRTLAAAQLAVRRVKRDLTAPETIEVVLAGGDYPLTAPWQFTSADSGFGRASNSHARTWPVTWRGAAGETVTVSGGRVIDGWEPDVINGREAWRADIPWVDPAAPAIRQLWIDGRRRPRARLPKAGTYRVAEAPDANYVGTHSQTMRRGTREFVFNPGDLSAAWANLDHVDIQFRGWWMSPRAYLLGIDEDTSTATLDRDTALRLAYAPGDGLDYIVENVLEGLTEPGEWWIDPVARRLWVLPLPGEQPDAVRAVIAGLDCLLDIKGASWLRFEHIAFAHAEWNPPPTESVAEQSSTTAPGAVRIGGGSEGIAFDDCRIEHVGGYGLECRDGVTDMGFRNGVIRDVGAGGVKFWHDCRRCVLDHSEIADGGHLWMSGAGVLIGKASGNAVTGCHIHDFYYTAISVGWTWGYAESDAYGNVIEWNHIHTIGKGLLSDMGGIYLLGNAMGTRVRHNHIHDIRSLRYGGWAIYPDEGSSDLLIENNLCYRTDRELFHQHYGRNNVVRNNIFAYGGEAVMAYSRMEDHLGLIVERNILLARGTPVIKAVSRERWRPDQVRFDRNLYWSEDGPFRLDSGMRTLATQPFVVAYADEAARFRPLPADGAVIRGLSTPGAMEGAITDAGEFRFTRAGAMLTITGTFGGVVEPPDPELPVWSRVRMEVFLKPFPDCPAMVQLGVAADGARALAVHACEPLNALDWESQATAEANGWSASLTVSLATIESAIRAAHAIPDARAADWRAMAAVTLPPVAGDFAAWLRHSGDTSSVEADPGFADPREGDFTLRPDSPAFALGFVPFAYPPDNRMKP